ncbi:hypothetical protein [Paenibacillus lautus]|uniref:hypothetical protein n=1 Tax=Paenibacillus lautus TaxID=1401 RepID=UPI003D2E0DA7
MAGLLIHPPVSNGSRLPLYPDSAATFRGSEQPASLRRHFTQALGKQRPLAGTLADNHKDRVENILGDIVKEFPPRSTKHKRKW